LVFKAWLRRRLCAPSFHVVSFSLPPFSFLSPFFFFFLFSLVWGVRNAWKSAMVDAGFSLRIWLRFPLSFASSLSSSFSPLFFFFFSVCERKNQIGNALKRPFGTGSEFFDACRITFSFFFYATSFFSFVFFLFPSFFFSLEKGG